MKGDLEIKAPSLGIGPSPHLGFGDIRNLDIYTIPGVARLNNLLAKKSSTTVTNFVKWAKVNPATPAQVFALDAAGQLYKSTDNGDTWATVSGETAGGAGQGFEFMNGYVIVARSASLDVYNISGNSWTNSWQTIDTDADWHPMLRSKNDGKIYGGAGRYVFSIEELTTFDPANGATFTFTQQALDLIKTVRIKSLAELGNDLMCGIWVGSNVYDFSIADIYPWDRSSPSFKEPIQLNVNGVHAMLNIGNLLWVLAGISGEIFLCNGVSADSVAQIPESVAALAGGKYLEFYPGAIMNYKGRPFFGVSVGGSNNIAGMGIWSIKRTSKGNVLTYEHLISSGNDGSSSVVKIGALCKITRDTFLAGWQDASTYGIDKTTNTSYYTSYSGYMESALYNVGTNLIPRTFQQGEFQLAKPLASNEGVKVKYRTNLNASFTTIGTYDFATLGAVLSHNFTPDIPSCEFCQVRIELTGTTTSPQFRQFLLR